jgi:hypothetical protein
MKSKSKNLKTDLPSNPAMIAAGVPILTTLHDLKVVVDTFNIFAWWIVLEGTVYHKEQFKRNGSEFTLELPQFPITGTLDVVLAANGGIGGDMTASITCDNKPLEPLLLTISKGSYNTVTKSYDI